MANNKKKLKLSVIDNKFDPDMIVEGITCFAAQSKYNTCCQRKACKNWIANDCYNNCSIIAAKDGPKTLQDIGEIFNLTRMRICQIEKNINKRLKEIL